MELYDVMTTTFSCREFTDDPIPDATLYRILERARFAPSGGNRQGWKVIVVRDRNTREGLSRAAEPAARRPSAGSAASESSGCAVVRVSMQMLVVRSCVRMVWAQVAE